MFTHDDENLFCRCFVRGRVITSVIFVDKFKELFTHDDENPTTMEASVL
jgi:hypothetical protein